MVDSNSVNSIKEHTEKAIRLTNETISKWILKNNLDIGRIEEEQVRSLLLHFLRKLVIVDPVDYKRFAKMVRCVTMGSKHAMLSGVHILPMDSTSYFRHRGLIIEVIKILETTKYENYHDAFDKMREVLEVSEEPVDIEFDSILNIRF